MIGTLLNGCNPEIPECGLSARRIVGGVDAAPGQWPWAAIVGTPIITTVGSEPGIQGLLKAPHRKEPDNWLPNTGWAISNAVECGTPPLAGGVFYSSKNWVGNCPPCPPASYAPD